MQNKAWDFFATAWLIDWLPCIIQSALPCILSARRSSNSSVVMKRGEGRKEEYLSKNTPSSFFCDRFFCLHMYKLASSKLCVCDATGVCHGSSFIRHALIMMMIFGGYYIWWWDEQQQQTQLSSLVGLMYIHTLTIPSLGFPIHTYVQEKRSKTSHHKVEGATYIPTYIHTYIHTNQRPVYRIELWNTYLPT